MIAGNFLAELFPVHIRNTINKSIIIKHIFGVLTLLCFIVIDKRKSIINSIKDTCKLYTFFLMLINNYEYNFVIVVILLAVSFIVGSKRNMVQISNDKGKNKEYYDKIQNGIDLIIYTMTAVGFISYFGNIKELRGGKFSLFEFLIEEEKYSKLPLSFMGGLANGLGIA